MSILVIQRFGVYHCENFQFEDGTSKNKFFIALNCSIKDSSINLVLPTSQYEKHYENSNYYLMDTVIIQDSQSTYFDKKTVIDLKNIHAVNSNILSTNHIIYKRNFRKRYL